MKKITICFALLFLLPLLSAGQQHKITGIVTNSLTGAPIENVNLKIRNSSRGTASDSMGRFTLSDVTYPLVIEVSCVGYESAGIEINNPVTNPLEISLQPASENLEGVVITDKRVVPVFQDRNFSVLDYELADGILFVLVYRYQLKKSELLLLSLAGDTLAHSTLPDIPPSRLYKDPLGYVHYFSKNGNAYQCFYNKAADQLQFIYKNDVDTVLKIFSGFQFGMNKRLFFVEETDNGFQSRAGYIDPKKGKTYLLVADNRKMAREYYDDLNAFVTPNRANDTFNTEAGMRAFELFYKPKHNARIVRAGARRFVIFNFISDSLFVYDSELSLLSMSQFSFHKEQKTNAMTTVFNAFTGNAWKWRWNLYSDDSTGKVYTEFGRQGYQMICEIDIKNGTLISDFVFPVLFPQKITIYNGDAFFLYKPIGENEKWRLYKVRL